MKYLVKVETQEEITPYFQKRLAQFLLETAPKEIIVTKVEVEDQQTGHSVSLNRGESQ